MKSTFFENLLDFYKRKYWLSSQILTKLTISFSAIIFATPSFAGTTYRSLSRDLTIDLSRSCSTVTPLSFYRTRNGVSGRLTDLDCSGSGDVIRFKFIDVTGNERCYGRMTISYGYRRQPKTVSIWEIDGAVSGFKCSVSGKKIEVEIFN